MPMAQNLLTQDNIIFSCLNSSFTDEVLVQVAHYIASHAVWTFASQSIAQAIQVLSQISIVCKTTKTTSEYFI